MSIKEILFSILEGVVGDFVVGFSSDQLKLALWSGKIELDDLQVNTKAIAKLGLPMKVLSGKVERLVINIPWTRLGSSPVQILIEGVSTTIGPDKASSEWTSEEVLTRISKAIRSRLEASDAAFGKVATAQHGATILKTEDGENKGLVARMATRIVDNLEIQLRRICVQYEDMKIRAAIEFASLEACAANEKWEAAFVDRSGNTATPDDKKYLRNLVSLEHFAVIWEEFDKKSQINERHIIKPLNTSLHLTRSEKKGEPRFQIQLATAAPAEVAIRACALRELSALLKRLNRHSLQRQYARFHPALVVENVRPVNKKNVKLWWKYAAALASPSMAEWFDRRSAALLIQSNVSSKRKKYVELFENQLCIKADRKEKKKISDADAVEEKKNDQLLRRMEVSIPEITLQTWRRSVLVQRRDLVDRLYADKKVEQKKGKKRRWLFFSSAPDDDEQTDDNSGPTLEELEEMAHKAEEEERSAESALGSAELVRATASLGLRLSLFDDSEKKLANAGFDLSVFARHTADNKETDLVAGVTETFVADATGQATQCGVVDKSTNRIIDAQAKDDSSIKFGGVLQRLESAAFELSKSLLNDNDAKRVVYTKNRGEHSAPFQLAVSRRVDNKDTARLDVVVRAISFRVVYHVPFVRELVRAFVPEEEDAERLANDARAAREKASQFAKERAAEAVAALERRATQANLGFGDDKTQYKLKLRVDAHVGAPTVLIPRSWDQPLGWFELNTGAIAVDGAIENEDSSRQHWKVTVSQVAIVERLPASLSGNAIEIIQPFCLGIDVILQGGPRGRKKVPKAGRSRAPVVVLVDGSKLGLALAPDSTQHLLEIAAILGKGLDGPIRENADKSAAQIIKPSISSSRTTIVSPMIEKKEVTQAKATSLDEGPRKASLEIALDLPLVEFSLDSDSGPAYVARAKALNFNLALLSGGDLELNATLQAISLDNVATGLAVLESFSAKNRIDSAQAAAAARAQLPSELCPDSDDVAFARDDALFTVRLSRRKASSHTTDIAISLSSVQARCGAETLRPLGPLMRGLYRGLDAFSTADKPATPKPELQTKEISIQQQQEDGGLRIVASIGELVATLSNATGTESVASAAVRGAAVAWASKAGAAMAAVRLADFDVDDARQNNFNAYKNVIVPKINATDSMLAIVDYKDDGKFRSLITSIEPVSLYVLPEPIYASLDASLDLVAVLLEVVRRPVSKQEVIAPRVIQTKSQRSESTQQLQSQQDRELKVTVNLPEAKVILIRDASSRDSEALLLQLGAEFDLSISSRDSCQELKITSNLRGLSVALAEYGLNAGRSPVALLDPSEASLSFERLTDESRGGVPFATTINADLTELDARVSYRDIVAVVSMFLALKPPPRKGSASSDTVAAQKSSSMSENAQISQETQQTQNVATLRVSVKIAESRITLVDNSLGASVPLLKLSTGAVDVLIDGPTSNLHGETKLSVDASSFNRDCLAFEPLVLGASLTASLTTKVDDNGVPHTNINLVSDELLEAVVSTSFIADLVRLGARLKEDAIKLVAKKDKAKPVRDAPPLLVANETELPMRCRITDDAEKSSDRWIDLAPFSRVSIKKNTSASVIKDAGLLEAPANVDLAPAGRDDIYLPNLVSGFPHRSIQRIVSKDGTKPKSAGALSGGIAWHVRFDDDSGRVLAKFRSRVMVVNKTDVPFELTTENSSTTTTLVEAQKTVPLTLDLARSGINLRIRRASTISSIWNWSTDTPINVWDSDVHDEGDDEDFDEVGLDEIDEAKTPSVASSSGEATKKKSEKVGHGKAQKRIITSLAQENSSGIAQYVIIGRRYVQPPANRPLNQKDEEALITIFPPIVVRSKLPVGVVVTLSTIGAESRLRLGAGEEVACCDLNAAKNGLWVRCRIADLYGKCETKITEKNAAKSLPPSTQAFGHELTGTPGLYEIFLKAPGMSTDDAFKFELRAVRKHRGLGLELTLSCPLWIVDKTGLGLAFDHAPPSVVDKLFCKSDDDTNDDKEVQSLVSGVLSKMQRVPPVQWFPMVTLWVNSSRPFNLVQSAKVQDYIYADDESAPYLLEQSLPAPLDKATRLLTYDAERGGPNNQPAIFSKFNQQHQQNMRLAGLESNSAKERRESTYIAIRNDDDAQLLEVYIAIDNRGGKSADWILDRGEFTRMNSMAPVRIMKKRSFLSLRQDNDVRQYTLWRSVVQPNKIVQLGPNENNAMYLVFLVRPEMQKKYSESESEASSDFDSPFHIDTVANDWLSNWPGKEWLNLERRGATLLCADQGRFAIKYEDIEKKKKSSWSSKLVAGSATFQTTIDNLNYGCFEFDVRPKSLPAPFATFGSLIQVVPRYAVWNLDTKNKIVLRQAYQERESEELWLEPNATHSTPWHWKNKKEKKLIQFGVPCEDGSIAWTIGAIPIDVIGGYALLTEGSSEIIRVEVALNDQTSIPPYESVTISASIEVFESALFAVRNSLEPQVLESDIILSHDGQILARVPPKTTEIFGWSSPLSRQKKLGIFLGAHGKKPIATVDADAIRSQTKITNSKAGDVYAIVRIEDGTRVIDFVAMSDLLTENEKQKANLSPEKKGVKTLTLNFKGIGASLIARDNSGIRRELVYARLSGLRGEFSLDTDADKFQLRVATFQLDNHIPKALWPTFISGSSDQEDTEGKDFFETSLIIAHHGDGTSSLRYFAARLLPVEILADLSSLTVLAAAVTQVPLDLLDSDVAMARNHTTEWVQSLCNISRNEDNANRLDGARRRALRRRGFIDALILHPMEARISFEPTRTEEVRLGLLSNLQTLATISRAEVRLSSFGLEQAVESRAALISLIVRHYIFQALMQIHRIIGSFASIGSPVNLVDSIGGGVQQFFYAPAKGVVESPQAFATGLYKGTAGLAGGVVGGVTSSIAGIGSAVGSNISMLSGDQKYIAEREARRRKFSAGGAGATAGFVEGGTSIFRGVADGVSGIVLQPIEGAKKDGALGAVKGFARGVVGVPVKTVVGVLDCATTVLQGVSQTASNVQVKQHLRPAMHLEHIPDSDEVRIPLPRSFK